MGIPEIGMLYRAQDGGSKGSYTPEPSEADPFGEIQPEKESVTAVRIFPLAPISVNKLREDLEAGTPIEEIELTRVKLAVKSKKSIPSHGLTMPLGGKRLDGETILQSVRRKLSKESLLYPLGGEWWKDHPIFKPIRPFTYTIIGRNRTSQQERESRKVTFVAYPIMPAEYTRLQPRNPEQDKIESIEGFSPREFQMLVENGQLRHADKKFKAVGHITLAESQDIEIEKPEREKKERALDQILERANRFESYIRDSVLWEISQERERKGEARAEALSECTHSEIISAFERVQIFLFMREDKMREQESVRRPPPGIDLLKFVWFLSGEGVKEDDMTPLLFEGPTKNIQKNLVRLVQSFRKSAEIVDGDSGWVSQPGFELTGLTERDAEASMFDTIVGKLRLMTPIQRFEYIDKLNGPFISEVAKRWHTDTAAVTTIQGHIDDFFRFLVDQSMAVNPEISKMFQAHVAFNEVTNAKLVSLYFLAKGINPYNPDAVIPDDRLYRQIKFEAARHLALLCKGMEAYKRYRELLDSGNGPIEAVLNGFFSAPYEEKARDVGETTHTVIHRQTEVLVDGKHLHSYVDEKPAKDYYSLLRKSFSEPLEDIFDVFSINIVLTDDNFSEVSDFGQVSKLRVQTALSLENSLVEYFEKACAASGWKVDVVGRKDKLGQLSKTPDELRKEGMAKGKRSGSKGDNIVRSKFYLVLTDSVGKQYAQEVIIYPFTNFKGTPYEKLLWGHDEKIEDDATGGYSFRRLTDRDMLFPDIPSFYEVLYPPHLYPIYAEKIFIVKSND